MDWIAPLRETVHIVFFILTVMMLMEFWELHRMRRGHHRDLLAGGKLHYCGQLVLSALMGFLPGCVGGFMVVSLYAHRAVRFGAVIAVSFTALGDDAFRMMAVEPLDTLWTELLLFPMGITVGALADWLLGKRKEAEGQGCRVKLHEADRHHEPVENGERKKVHKRGARDWSVSKVFLCMLLTGYSVWLMVETFGLDKASQGLSFDFESLLFSLFALTALIFVFSADRHFLREHLWCHLFKKHFPSIFLWTLGTLYFLAFFQQAVDLQAWIENDPGKQFLLLLAAIAIGWIPQSGPHFLFIQLYFTGVLPWGVFFANAIVQDGHTSLLLLAESRRGFILLKAGKSLVAIAVGGGLLLL